MKQQLLSFMMMLLLMAVSVDASETKTITMPTNGVYVFDTKGDFYTYESWNVANNDKVIGIALITDNTKALIALKNANTNGYVVWGPDGLVNGVVTTESNNSNRIPGIAKSDYNGASNTQKEVEQLSPQSNTALYLANAYIFPNKLNGYLPALGELIDMFANLPVVNNLLNMVGGEIIEDFWYWSSTQHYLYYRAWAYDGTDSDSNKCFAQLRNENSPLASVYGPCRINVRPFGVIPRTIEIENDKPETPADYVDLGLPSGLLWATCNLGASSPEEVGGYYAWGETSPKTFFSRDNYKYKDTPISINDISGTEYDAATVTLGGTWRMPTKSELEELANKCTRKEITLNGTVCMELTGPNNNTLIIARGGLGEQGNTHENGYGLWSSTKNSSSTAFRAWEWTYISYSWTWQGIPIRPVRMEQIAMTGDANGDGVVDVADVVAIVNFIIEKPAENFNIKAADVNGDEVIDAADVVGVVNIILENGDADASRTRAVLRKNGFIF